MTSVRTSRKHLSLMSRPGKRDRKRAARVSHAAGRPGVWTPGRRWEACGCHGQRPGGIYGTCGHSSCVSGEPTVRRRLKDDVGTLAI